jgi:RNA polymerase sigma-70 factor (ECF subfamily)
MPELQHGDEIWLIEESQKGSSEAFGRLYELYAPRVFRFLFAHLEDRMDAEDLTIEVFSKVWQYIPGYDERGTPFSGFLFRVARNVLIDHYRRSNRLKQKETLKEELVDSSQPDPAEAFSSGVEHKELRSLLAQLREDHRSVLSYRFLAELSPEETAYAMEKSPGAVRVLQHRALTALRKLMIKKEKETDGKETS